MNLIGTMKVPLNLCSLHKVFQIFGKNKRRPGHSAPHKGVAKSWPSCSSADLLFSFVLTQHGDDFLHEKPLC